MRFVRRTLFDYFDSKDNEDDSIEYVRVECLKTLPEEILGTDGEFYAIIEGRKMKLPKETAEILEVSGIVKIVG